MLIVHIFSLHIDNGSFSAYISESNQIFTNCWDLSANSPHQELIYSPDNKTWGSIFVSELLFHMTFFGQPGLSSWKRWSELDASAEASGCSPLWVETGNLHLATRLSSFFLEFQVTLLGGTVRLVNVRLSAPRLEKSCYQYSGASTESYWWNIIIFEEIWQMKDPTLCPYSRPGLGPQRCGSALTCSATTQPGW